MRVRAWAGSGVFNELFRMLVKMRPHHELRHISWFIFFSKLLVLLMRHNWLASLSNYVD